MINYPYFSDSIIEASNTRQDNEYPLVDLERVCPSLYEIVKFLKEWSPESFEGYHIACAIAMLSMISAGRVKFELGGNQACNLYIVLVGTTGISAKSTALKLITAIIHECDLEFLLLPDQVTASKFITEMVIQVPENLEFEKAEIRQRKVEKVQRTQLYKGQRGWIFDEFGGLLREMMQKSHHNAGFRETLKRLYDNNQNMKIGTQIRGVEEIHYPFLTLLGAMTPADLSPYAIKRSAIWQDGFLARIAFVVPSEGFVKNAPFPDGPRIIPQVIVRHLQEWHYRLGEPVLSIFPEINVVPAKGEIITIPQDVREMFYEYRRDMKDKITQSKDSDLDGNFIRYPDTALKIAVLIASVNGKEALTVREWKFAKMIAEDWRNDLIRLYNQDLPAQRLDDMALEKDEENRIFKILVNRGPLSSRELQQQTRKNAEKVNQCLAKLEEEEKIIGYRRGERTVYDLSLKEKMELYR